jgi:TonB family protein
MASWRPHTKEPDMKTAFVLASILLLGSGCATSGNGLPGRDGKLPHNGPGGVPDIDRKDDAPRTQLTRLSPAEFETDLALHNRIRVELYGVATTELRMCVTPNGAVDSVDVVDSSGLAAYDQTVVSTVQGWQYAAFTATPGTRVCQPLTVSYRAP